MRVDKAKPTAVALDEATVAFRLADGRVYANHYVFTFRFRGELISEIAEYLDTAYAQKLLAFTIEAPKS